MPPDRADVLVLGAGPAGVGAAYQLSRTGRHRVVILEQRDIAGGNAGSFELEGLRVDYGSHRLHPTCDPEILVELRQFLGSDLLDRPRHGRIRLAGKWIHFPLKPADLLLHMPKRFAAGISRDLLAKLLPPRKSGTDTFALILERGLGRTICNQFYFPYARKLWGLSPEELSVTQARRRVSANSLGRMLKKVASAIPGLKPPGAGRFFYPRHGFGQISETLCQAAARQGAHFVFGTRVSAVERDGNRITRVRYEREGRQGSVEATSVWSTLPITLLSRGFDPGAPADVLHAASSIRFRGMVLIYLVLEQDRFSEYDAHYFPEEAIPISRLSEPKNYSASPEPHGITVLCAELPSDPDSAYWQKSDAELGEIVRESLASAGIPIRVPVRRVVTRKLRQAYPIYERDYERHFRLVDRWLAEFTNLLTFGRQGLFAHDNTHHALYMAYAAAKCLGDDGCFDQDRWRGFRRIFETHVVED